jgi:hypothetical protein
LYTGVKIVLTTYVVARIVEVNLAVYVWREEMPKPTTQVMTVATTEVALKPLLKRQLLNELRKFQTNHAEIKAKQAEQDAIEAKIESLFTSAGEMNTLQAGVKVDGFSVKHHTGETTSKLDKVALCRSTGITMAQIDAATKVSPKKTYTKINVPGQRKQEAE